MTKLSFGLASFLILANVPFSALADSITTEEWEIEADKVLRFDNPKSVIAEGGVVLKKVKKLPPKPKGSKDKAGNWANLLEENNTTEQTELTLEEIDTNEPPRLKTEVTINADWIAYDVEHNSIKAKGNISIISDTDQLLAQEGTLELNKETGTFREAAIIRKTRDLHLEGKLIEKTGATTYHIEDGWVVTCKIEGDETPPWSFAAASADITQGEYATLKHATFRIKDVPVLYTPWLMVPVGNTRKTGLLFPEFYNSKRSGFGINQPLFINISDSSDITLYSEYYSNRGVMPGLEFRYALAPQKKAGIIGNYLNDDLSDPSEKKYWEETGYTHTNNDRYWVRGKLDHDFTSDLISRIDLDIVSDRDYLTEFNSGLTGFETSQDKFLDVFGRGFQNKTNDQRESSFKILRSWEGMALEGVFLGINDVRTVESAPTPLWKLPSLDFTGSQLVGESDLSFDWDTNYVNYYRDEGLGGHRFDIYPRLSMPLPLGPYLESRVEGGVRDTFYNVKTYGKQDWSESDTANRFLGEFHTEIGTTLLKKFGASLQAMDGLAHRVRPFVQYDFLTDTNQDDLPDFDATDRIEDANKITYGIDNFFTLFKTNNSSEKEKDYSYLKIQQSYDLRSSKSDNPLSPINIKIGWYPFGQGGFLYKTNIGVYGNGSSHTVVATYANSRGDHLDLDYRYDDLDGHDTHQVNLKSGVQLWDTIFASYGIEHSISQSEIIEQNISLLYKPTCWSVELKSKYTPGDHTISILFSLANIGDALGVKL